MHNLLASRIPEITAVHLTAALQLSNTAAVSPRRHTWAYWQSSATAKPLQFIRSVDDINDAERFSCCCLVLLTLRQTVFPDW